MRIVEANLNLRIERGYTNMDYFLERHIAQSLCSIPDVDIYAMVEYMKCLDEDFLDEFKKQGYTPITMLDKKQRGILIEVKNHLHVSKVFELSHPHFLHLKLKINDQDIDFIAMRILVGGYLSESEFQKRREQFIEALNYIKTLNADQVIIVGDFNNASIRDDYRKFIKNHYNYQWIIEQFNKASLNLVPIDGFSHKNYLKEDHIIIGKSFICENAYYDDELFYNPNYIYIGYPDHNPLIADLQFSCESK